MAGQTPNLKSFLSFIFDVFGQWNWQWSGVMKPQWRADYFSSCIHHWLELPKKMLKNTGQCRVNHSSPANWRQVWSLVTKPRILTLEWRMERSRFRAAKHVNTIFRRRDLIDMSESRRIPRSHTMSWSRHRLRAEHVAVDEVDDLYSQPKNFGFSQSLTGGSLN